jgi:hypothetical protein
MKFCDGAVDHFSPKMRGNAMMKLLCVTVMLSAAMSPRAQPVAIEVPGLTIKADGTGNVRVDSPSAEIKINGQTVLKAHRGAVTSQDGRTLLNSAVVNAAVGPGARSEQVINGRSTVVERTDRWVDPPAKSIDGGRTAAETFVNAELKNRDFSGWDLAGADFTNAALINVKFRRTNLRQADFTNAELIGCDFEGADLKRANFTNARFENTRIENAIR